METGSAFYISSFAYFSLFAEDDIKLILVEENDDPNPITMHLTNVSARWH